MRTADRMLCKTAAAEAPRDAASPPGPRGLQSAAPRIALSFVIPVYNSSHTLRRTVADIFAAAADQRAEIVLVNDGSADNSEEICSALVAEYPGAVSLIQLARNYGEHNAVMAGLRQARGDYAVIIDDDGQHSPTDALRMLAHARANRLDVVYGRFRTRQHSSFRVAGSALTNFMADWFLPKPRGLYLSSFKVVNRFVIDQIGHYRGPSPYVDGLIFRVTDRIAQIDVDHGPRAAGRSGYTLPKLLSLWLSIFVEYSLVPMRIALFAGAALVLAAVLAVAVLAGLRVFGAAGALPAAWIAALVAMGLGFQMLLAGFLGEYIGRLLLHQSAMPQQTLRYISRIEPDTADLDDQGEAPRNYVLVAK